MAKSMPPWTHRFEAGVTLHTPAETIRKRFPSHWGAVQPIDDHSCEYRTGDDDLDWLALRIAMFGGDFDVHEPPELAEHLRAMARRLERAGGPIRSRPGKRQNA